MSNTPLDQQVGYNAVTQFVTADFVALCLALASDELTLINAVAGLPPPAGYTYGRYANGNLTSAFSAAATVAQANAAVVLAGAAVEAAGAALNALGDATTGSAYGPAAQALIEALRAAAINPSDAVRLMVRLAEYRANAVTGYPGLLLTILFRRLALASLALACASYAPTSYQDAAQLLTQVVGLFDREIQTAANIWDGQVYADMRALRTSVVLDLSSRGAQLPILDTITTPTAQPALALAYALYGDATRSDDLVQRGDPINPLFMPTTLTVLNS